MGKQQYLEQGLKQELVTALCTSDLLHSYKPCLQGQVWLERPQHPVLAQTGTGWGLIVLCDHNPEVLPCSGDGRAANVCAFSARELGGF